MKVASYYADRWVINYEISLSKYLENIDRNQQKWRDSFIVSQMPIHLWAWMLKAIGHFRYIKKGPQIYK